jgi:hypothetical protein
MNVTATSSQFRMSLAALCAIFAAGSSSAIAAGWTTPAILGAPDASWVATAGADNKGSAVAAWLQTDTIPYKVYASLRKAGNLDFGLASGLSGPSTTNPYPLVARIDRFRNIFVVWEDQGSVYGVVRPAGANTWPEAELIASGVSLAGFEVDKSGNATMLVGTSTTVEIIDRPAGASWSGPQIIASHTFSEVVFLAMADDGGAVATWETYDKPNEFYTNIVLHASRRQNWGGSWGPIADLSVPLTTFESGPTASHAATIAMDPRGNVVVAGRRLDNDTNFTLGALTLSADSNNWSALQLVTTAGTQAGYPSVAVDGSGFATLVWATSGSVFVANAQIPANVWTAPAMISSPGVVTGYPAVGTNRAGFAAVTWPTINNNGSMSLQATVRPGRIASWGPPVSLSTSPAGVSNALPRVDNADRVLAVWNETPASFNGQTTKTSTYLP